MRVSNSAPGKGEGGNTVPKVSIGLKIEIPAGWPRVSTMQGAESRLEFSPLLLVGSNAETSTQWASCCSATTPTPPGYPGAAPTGFRGLMQPFFSWKDAHLNRSREAKGGKRSALQQLSSVSWKAAVTKLHPRCPKSNLTLRRGIPREFLQRIQTASGKKSL